MQTLGFIVGYLFVGYWVVYLTHKIFKLKIIDPITVLYAITAWPIFLISIFFYDMGTKVAGKITAWW